MRRHIKVYGLSTIALALFAALLAPRVEALLAPDTLDGISRNAPLGASALSDPAAIAPSGRLNFEPGKEFVLSMPLQVYNNRSSGAYFLTGPRSGTGNGVILDVSSFNVTGHSPPNAMAWNASGLNADGTIPRLPQVILFFINKQRVAVQVASNTNAGATASLVALSSRFEVLGVDSVSLTPAVQGLEVLSAGRDITFAVILGPDVMIADDFIFE